MEYTIKNTGKFAQAFKVHGGMAIVDPGKSRTLTLKRALSDEDIVAFALKGVMIKATKAEIVADDQQRRPRATRAD